MRSYSPSFRQFAAVPLVALAVGAFMAVIGLFRGQTLVESLTVGLIAFAFLLFVFVCVVLMVGLSLLRVDGQEVIYWRPGRTRRLTVGPGWRMVEYREGYGRNMQWYWFLLDPRNDARLKMPAALWPKETIELAFTGTSVTIHDANRLVTAHPIDALSTDEIMALDEFEAERLIDEAKDRSLPPFPTRVID